MSALLTGLLYAALALSLAGLAVVLAARARRRATVGRPLRTTRAPRLARWTAALAWPAALAAVGALPMALALPAALLLLAGLATWLFAPAAGDGVCGEDGVAAGWEAARWEALAEWRLTGDHLRWRSGEEWRAVSVPRAEHGPLRALLERHCPDAESRFAR